MKTILVTGAQGFIGKNLIAALTRLDDINIIEYDIHDSASQLKAYLKDADLIYHLAGINRPQEEKEFETGNVDLTHTIVDILKSKGKRTPLVFSSSTQALLDNPYGSSKKRAEDVLMAYHREHEAKVYIYRLPNVFGKWSRPNYNSAVATFCHNISRGLDIYISDINNQVELVYIDDVVNAFLTCLSDPSPELEKTYYTVEKTFRLTLGELVDKIHQLHDIQETLILPDLSDEFMRYLYATYLSFLDKKSMSYPLDLKKDHRGSLAEILKSPHSGQIFISKSFKKVIRGNHYHNTKTEKFCVIQGKAIIKLRHINENNLNTFQVSGDKIEIIDIPPGYTHSIENISEEELLVLFWASEIFNPENPDTYYQEV